MFLTLGRNRRLFWAWLLFAGALMPGGRLPRRETELVILRVATLCGSEYELTQHRRLGRRAGLTADEVDRVAGAGRRGLSDVGAAPAAGRRRAARHRGPHRRDLDRPARDPDERLCLELVMLVGHYRMLATALTTLRVAPDRARGAR